MTKDVWQVEYTDTYGGEANYSWVRRATVSLAPVDPDTVYTSAATVARKHRAYRRELILKAKEAIGLTGVRGRMVSYGDMYEFRPYRSCTVMFVTFDDRESGE
ncbi:MAG: hypothetical protein AAFR27_08735 [Pseudomonadota bacterium]